MVERFWAGFNGGTWTVWCIHTHLIVWSARSYEFLKPGGLPYCAAYKAACKLAATLNKATLSVQACRDQYAGNDYAGWEQATRIARRLNGATLAVQAIDASEGDEGIRRFAQQIAQEVEDEQDH